jgi:uncharacterized protein
MIIEVDKLPVEGARFKGEEVSAILDLDREEGIRLEGPIRYDLKVKLVTGELLVNGVLGIHVSLRCSRCVDFFQAELVDPSFSCIQEVAERTESVDLTSDIREAMLLVFPTHPLCGGDCKGLCARCGGNLKRDECRCKPAREFRWGGLDNLKLN